MQGWRRQLTHDPIPQLLSSDNDAVRFFTQRDLIGEGVGSVISLWQLNQVDKIIRKQQDNGSWKYSGGRAHIRSSHHYNQLETYRVLGQLIEKYGVTNEHPAIRKAADSYFLAR
ncbi:MAG: hypothetical protein E3J37_01005 [Anaerolineales bacterium]|nr:MAG: hypothetical protein E3J37_01005 [Anaerolineales bacterium]